MAQDRVCNSCGGALNEDSKFCPACGMNVEIPSDVDCPSCGEKNAPGSKYCDQCGSFLLSGRIGVSRPKIRRIGSGGRLRNTVKPENKLFARKLRKQMTPSEKLLWGRLRRKQIGIKFRRQVVIRGWIVDFYSPAAKLAVEVDGGYHNKPKQKRRDTYRESTINKLGISVIRFTNREVTYSIEKVIEEIQGLVAKRVS